MKIGDSFNQDLLFYSNSQNNIIENKKPIHME